MTMTSLSARRLLSVTAAAAIALSGLPSAALAAETPTVPFSYETNPEIYKVLSENDDFRVILASWPPGARDGFHSHPVSFMSYFLTDCSRRFYFPDGKTTDTVIKKGFVVLSGPIESHSFQNTGTEVCQILLVDKKR